MSTLEITVNKGFKLKCSSSEIFNRFDRFRQTDQFCDIKLIADGEEFIAHKAVLAACSVYFETMFSGQFREAQRSSVVLQTIGANEIKIILNFAYSKLVEVSHSNVQAVMHAANYFQVDSLFSACCDYLERNINTENCFGIWRLHGYYSDRFLTLAKKARLFINTNFADASVTQEFLELTCYELTDIIQSNLLNVDKEDTVFEAVVRWLQFKNERISEFDKVLSHVRLAFVNPLVLNDWSDRLNLYDWPACMKLIEEAKKYHLLPSRRSDVLCSIRTPRDSAPKFEVLMIQHTCVLKFSKLNLLKRNGDIVETFTYPPGECRNIVVSNHTKMIVACCWDKLYNYHSGTKTWTALAANLKPRYFFGLCELDGMWYSIGGKVVGGRICDAFEKYDPSSNTWKALPFMPRGVSSPAVVCHRGMIFVIGGHMCGSARISNIVQRYDPRTQSWVILTKTPVPLMCPAACVLDGMIYVFCFLRPSMPDGQRVFVYDPLTNQWDVRCDVPFPFLGGPVCMDGNIYVLARVTDNLSSIFRYMPLTDSWDLFREGVDENAKFLSGPFIFKNPL